jgi:hypothetical protein
MTATFGHERAHRSSLLSARNHRKADDHVDATKVSDVRKNGGRTAAACVGDLAQ